MSSVSSSWYNRIKHVVILSFVLFIQFSSIIHAQQLAFPGAEGYGRFALGARASSNPTVYRVTNLNDSGTGSFRDAISQPNRVIVFDVAGVIKINSRLIFSKNLTIAGQTAPGEGVVIYGNGVSFSNAENIIVQYLRLRMGKDGDSGKDAAGIANGGNMIFDHLSVSWGLDETFSINWDSKGFEPYNITIQNSIMGQGFEPHSAGGLLQTDGGVTVYRNLYIDNKTRNPKVKGLNQYINNVVYNWGSGGAYILGDTEAPSWAEITDNYFIKGPTGSTNAFTRAKTAFQVYQKGNMIDYNTDGILNGYEALENDFRRDTSNPESENVTFVNSINDFDYSEYSRRKLDSTTGTKEIVTTTPELHPRISNEMSATEAYYWIVNNVGASLPVRDEVDKYMINDVLSLGTNGFLKNNETELGLTGGVGNVFNGESLLDSDGDGMPDSWEDANNLDKNNPADAVTLADNGYLNIENYIHSITTNVPYIKYPTNLQLSARGTDYLTFKWINNEVDATNVILEYAIGDGEFNSITLDPTISLYKLESLSPDQSYSVRLKTVKGDMKSYYTPTISASTIGVPNPPIASINPVPTNGTEITEYVSTSLSWDNLTTIWGGQVTYTVFFGESESQMVPVATDITVKKVTVDLKPSATYYWYVEAKNAMGTCNSDTWSFSTYQKPIRTKVAYYSFDESDGSTLANVYGPDAFAKDYTPTWINGIKGNAANFNTPNAAFVQEHYDDLTLGNESFSIEFWFKAEGGTVDWYLLHKGSHATTSYEGATGKWFGIQYQKNTKNDRLTWAIDDDKTKTDLNATSATSNYFNNEWVHLVCVRDVENKELKMYVNGALIGTATDKTGDIGNIENMAIANCNTAYTNGFQGAMDELSIYKDALTPSEITELYNQGTATHIVDIERRGDVKVYPMPFVDEVYISIPDTNIENAQFYITNTAGAVVYSSAVSLNNGVAHISGLSFLPSGYYVFRLTDGHENIFGKLVK